MLLDFIYGHRDSVRMCNKPFIYLYIILWIEMEEISQRAWFNLSGEYAIGSLQHEDYRIIIIIFFSVCEERR